MMGGLGWIGWIFQFAFWILIIVGLIFLIKWLIQASRGERSEGSRSGSRAMEILRERYARGEITKEEFDRMKRDLRD
jgi:putative membrane protein